MSVSGGRGLPLSAGGQQDGAGAHGPSRRGGALPARAPPHRRAQRLVEQHHAADGARQRLDAPHHQGGDDAPAALTPPTPQPPARRRHHRAIADGHADLHVHTGVMRGRGLLSQLSFMKRGLRVFRALINLGCYNKKCTHFESIRSEKIKSCERLKFCNVRNFDQQDQNFALTGAFGGMCTNNKHLEFFREKKIYTI